MKPMSANERHYNKRWYRSAFLCDSNQAGGSSHKSPFRTAILKDIMSLEMPEDLKEFDPGDWNA
jgi:hypothetical protein